MVTGLTIDGPSADISALGGLALADDSTGGVVYLKAIAGAPHVFVSTLAAGAWAPPQQVDGGVGPAASQPVIAAAGKGRLAVVWISGGELWGVVRPAGAQAFSAPQAIAPALSNPSLAMGLSGTAYASYTVQDGAGTDVDVARLDRTSTSFVPLGAPLNSSPATMAGSGAALRSQVSVAADATGIVAWGEQQADGRSHVLVRRVFGLSESVQTLDLTLAQLQGQPGASADTPVVGSQDDSSYAWVAFRQLFASGSGQISRVVAQEVVGSALENAGGLDGLSFPTTQSADAPSIAVNGNGDGLAAAELSPSNLVVAATTAQHGFAPAAQVNQVTDLVAPTPITALSRDGVGIVAWQPYGGTVVGRLYDDGMATSEAPLSNPSLGPVAVGSGFDAAADAHGDLLVGFLQGGASALRLAVAAAVPAPAPFAELTPTTYLPTARPVLAWTAARQFWGPISYLVLIDGKQFATTSTTSFRPPTALRNGTHNWRVVAVDRLGQQTPGRLRPLRIDTHLPTVSLLISGAHEARSALTFTVRLRPSRRPVRLRVEYGDGGGSSATRSHHAYRHAGTYLVTATVTGHARHSEVVKRSLLIG